jgi:hypothetical protein
MLAMLAGAAEVGETSRCVRCHPQAVPQKTSLPRPGCTDLRAWAASELLRAPRRGPSCRERDVA